MKLAFVTAGLEADRDGVADYTRLLAGELTRQGHPCGLLGLHDALAPKPKRSELAVDGRELPVLRLPPSLPWPERVAQGRRFLEAFGPDWASLQFVCYGFHPKGLVAGLDRHLEALLHGRPRQIMFHELWIGPHRRARLADRITGLAQRFFLRRLLARLRPAVIHTSNPVYVRLLRRIGGEARCLPLFGNPPVTGRTADDWLPGELRAAGIDMAPETRARFWLFGMFGTLHPVWPPEPLLARLAAAAERHQRRPVIVSIGRLGSGEALWARLAREQAGRIAFARLGERSGEQISQFFNSIDFGIATSPLALIGKSGSAVAMLEHDLPVIVNREEIQFPGFDPAGLLAAEPNLIRLDDHLERRLAEARPRRPHRRLPDVAGRMLGDLAAGAVTPRPGSQ